MQVQPRKRKETRRMIIAIPVCEGKFSSHFGGADAFALYTIDEADRKVIRHETAAPPEHGRGVFPMWLRNKGVTPVLAGGTTKPPSVLRLATASIFPRLEPTGITAPKPELSAGAGHSSSSVSTRWTRWCVRSAVGKCGSSRSSSTTMSWTRSCDTSPRPRRGLLAVPRSRQPSPPLPELHVGCSRQCGVCSW